MRALAKLNRYLWKYRGRLFLGLVFIVLSNLFGVFTPRLINDAIDLAKQAFAQGGKPAVERHLTEPETLALWLGWTGLDLTGRLRDLSTPEAIARTVTWLAALLAVLYLVFALLKGLFTCYMRQTIIVVSRLIEYDLKNAVFDHYQRLDRAFYKRNNTGDLMNRISEDVSQVRMYLGPAIMYTINLVVLFVLCIVFMFNKNPELALWTLTPLPVLSVLIYYVSDVMNKRSMAVQRQQSRLSTLAQESFAGIRVLKAYAKEDMATARFTEGAREYRRLSLRQAKMEAMWMPSIMLLIGLSTTLTIFIGSLKLIQGDPTVTVGTIAAFVVYVNMLTWPFASVGWVTSLVQTAAASMERINEFLETRPDITSADDALPEVKGNVTFDHVGFTYPDTGITALDDVSFEVPAGGTLAVVGHTGSGKSTIAELIARQYDATAGEIRIDGVPIQRVALEKLRNGIGHVPQDVFLFSDTIRNNIAFSLDRADDDVVARAARTAQVHDNVMGFPKGYDTILGERGITLSGGQKQRVSIARAIARDPRILILDDPLSAVDTATEEAILRGFKKEMQGRTTIIISHRISAVQEADHILVLEHGRIAEEGKHAALLAKGGVYAKLYEEQLLEEERKASA